MTVPVFPPLTTTVDTATMSGSTTAKEDSACVTVAIALLDPTAIVAIAKVCFAVAEAEVPEKVPAYVLLCGETRLLSVVVN